MGKDLKGKELGKGISQESTGLYLARFVDRFGKRRHKRFKKLQECRAWIDDATYVDEHSDISMPSEKKVALTRDIQKTFLQYAENQSYENQYRFILQTGLRTGELVGLKWEDVDFKSKTIQIRRSMEYRYSAKEWRIGEPKSKSGYRTIPFTEEAVAILKKQKEKNKRISEISTEWEEFVFLCRKGTPVKNSTYDTALFKICDKAKIPRFSMHILRHTFATRCIEAGMKPKTLQMLLGHSNIGITMNLYVHTTEEEKKKEMELIGSRSTYGNIMAH